MLKRIKSIMAREKTTATKKKNTASATITGRRKRNDEQISVEDQILDNTIRTETDDEDQFIPIRIENRQVRNPGIPLIQGQAQLQGNPQQVQNAFDHITFQDNLLNLLEQRFDKADEKRERDNFFIKSQMKTIQNKTSREFKSIANKVQYNFTQNLFELNNEAKIHLEANNKELSSVLEKVEKELLKRQKIIVFADRSVAGWNSVNEYLPDELIDDGDDDKWRKAESRAISGMKRKHQQDGSSSYVPPKRFMPSQHYQVPQIVPAQRVQHVFPQQQQLVLPLQQRPFLWQGASGEGTSNRLQFIPNQPQRYPVPLNACFVCGETGHWKHQCPKRSTMG
ncbi:uncharacterized protein [Clytia hemisphaerica]|uniref:CCHC-type domain-containing protein n=1 Tax=Clytia hemisphaerica TaxID=252671 RepID=A0A7M5XGY4_9CNID